MDTHKSYIDLLIGELSAFHDPFSKAELRTELQCYPISFVPHERLGMFEGAVARDLDDDQLLYASLQRDIPESEARFSTPVLITDGAAFLFNNSSKYSLLAVLGAPGLGKSSLLRKLALLMAQEAKYSESGLVPLLVDLRVLGSQIRREVSNMMEFFELCLGQYEEFEAFLRDQWLKKRIALLLDGLEHTDSSQRRVCEWIQGLSSVYSAPFIVVTSRLNGFCGLPKAEIVRMELLPLKLQLNAAQYLLSEMQFERFVETVTGSQTHFSEFASTPVMLGLLLDMFRWGLVGAEKELSRGKLLELALKHIAGAQLPASVWSLLETVGLEVLKSGLKDFTLGDIYRMGLRTKWLESLSDVMPLFHRLDRSPTSQSVTALPELSDEDYLPITVDAEEAIGAVRETPMGFRADTTNKLHHREATPWNVSLSRDSFMNYQAARSFISPTSDTHTQSYNAGEDSRMQSSGSELYRFAHLRLAEVLAARHLHGQVLDLVASGAGHFVMESSLYTHAFGDSMLSAVLFTRTFRETVLIFSSLCNDSVFENFIKYLLSRRQLEYVYLAYRALKERGNFSKFRPLINKMQQQMATSARKQFVYGYCHPSSAVRRLVITQCIEANVPESELHSLALKHCERVLGNWVQVRHLRDWCRDGSRFLTKTLMKQIANLAMDMVTAAGKHAPFQANHFGEMCTLLVRLLEESTGEKSLGASFPSSASSSSLNSPSSYSSPAYKQEPARTERLAADADHTLRITFDRFHFPELHSAAADRLGGFLHKTQSYLLEVLTKCESIDLLLTTRLLQLIECPPNIIHLSLATRVQTLREKSDTLSVLSVLKEMGFVTQHTIDALLECMESKHAGPASDILRQLNMGKLKSYAMAVITKDNPPEHKARLAIRALGFTCRHEVDEEVVHILTQFADHYNLVLRLEALASLQYLLTNCSLIAREKCTIQSSDIRRTLAPLPFVLKDRLRLQKYPAELQIASMKLIIALWVALDRSQEDTHSNDMKHILIPEQLDTSYMVGSQDAMVQFLSRQLKSEEVDMRLAVWQAVKAMDLLQTSIPLSEVTRDRLLSMAKESLADIEESVQLCALKFLKSLPSTVISFEAIKQELKLNLFSSRKALLKEVAKIFYRMNEVEDLRKSFPSVASGLVSSCPLDLCSALENFSVVSEVITSMLHTEMLDRDLSLKFDDQTARDGSKVWHCRTLVNQYKALVNCIAEGLQSPGARSSMGSGRRMELLEISLDPSYIKGDQSDSDLSDLDSPQFDTSAPRQNSVESQNTEVEDGSGPPPLSLCHCLLKAGVRTEALKQWVFWYLTKSPGTAILPQVAACVSFLQRDEDLEQQSIEANLLSCCREDPNGVALCIVNLNFKSDVVALELVHALRAGLLTTEQTVLAIGKCAELRTSECLELLLDSVDFVHETDVEVMKRVQKKAAQVLETMSLTYEFQLCTALEVLCRRPSALLLQPVWQFVLKELGETPTYTLPTMCQRLLLDAKTWEGKMLRRWCRRIGVFSVERLKAEEFQTQPTAKSLL